MSGQGFSKGSTWESLGYVTNTSSRDFTAVGWDLGTPFLLSFHPPTPDFSNLQPHLRTTVAKPRPELVENRELCS